ncbi:MAG: hypothetical protein Q9207_005534 [Kuettlingeria erythrocarpa]
MSMPSVSLLAPDFKVHSVRSARTNQSLPLTVHAPNGDPIIWPEVPSSVPNGKEFECPFCFFICPEGQRTGEPWRVHLKHDLCPYVCTFPDCVEPDTLYESRDQWIQHEQWSHMCFWRCPKDTTEFEDLPSYKMHVNNQHPAAADKKQLLSEGILATQRFLAKQPTKLPGGDTNPASISEQAVNPGITLDEQSIAGYKSVDEIEASKHQVGRANVMEEGRYLRPSMYKKAEVLIFCWEEHCFYLDNQTEIEQLVSVLEVGFGYGVTIVYLYASSTRLLQVQLQAKVAGSIDKHDGSDTLLIVYCAGHGTTEESFGDLETFPKTWENYPREKKERLRNNLVWNITEDIMRSARADVATPAPWG